MATSVLLTIPTTRLEASEAFYRDVLQFTLKERLDRPGGVVLIFLVHPCGFTVELVAGPRIAAGEVGPGAPLLSFLVEDYTDITARLKAAGYAVPEAVQVPGGVALLRFLDPNGVLISFVTGAH